MTGKEALIQVSKSCSALALEFGNLKIGKTDNEALQTLKEIVQKYDKYKSAFEIIKKYKMIYDLTDYETSQEEYELLEELMKNDN